MDVAVVVNLRARRGTEAVARMVRARLPGARVRVTRTLADVRRWIERELAPAPPELLLSGGGDGTAVTLLNELRDRAIEIDRLGVLRLGTGNGWANATGAPAARQAIERLARLSGARPPTRRFALVEAEGKVAPFLGTGLDAELISDFQATTGHGVLGYVAGGLTRTIPRHLFGGGAPHVTVTNLGEDALTVDDQGRVVPLPGGARGRVVYRGPAIVAAAATTVEWGFGFRAFPFAHAAPGRVSVRVYSGRVLEATRHLVGLWRGEHPIPKMHDLLLTHGRMEFDREVPFQIGGDLAGPRTRFEFRLADRAVDMVDWSRLPSA
jgi:diacylglycerol kinase family enzyme